MMIYRIHSSVTHRNELSNTPKEASLSQEGGHQVKIPRSQCGFYNTYIPAGVFSRVVYFLPSILTRLLYFVGSDIKIISS